MESRAISKCEQLNDLQYPPMILHAFDVFMTSWQRLLPVSNLICQVWVHTRRKMAPVEWNHISIIDIMRIHQPTPSSPLIATRSRKNHRFLFFSFTEQRQTTIELWLHYRHHFYNPSIRLVVERGSRVRGAGLWLNSFVSLAFMHKMMKIELLIDFRRSKISSSSPRSSLVCEFAMRN